MTIFDTACIAESMGNKFREIQKLVSELSVDASECVSALPLDNHQSRSVVYALTRMTALSDQIDMTLHLVREDLQIVEEAAAEPAETLWREFLQDAFDEHCCSISMAGGKVH